MVNAPLHPIAIGETALNRMIKIVLSALAFVGIVLATTGSARASELMKRWSYEYTVATAKDPGAGIECPTVRWWDAAVSSMLVGICASGRNRDCQASKSHIAACSNFDAHGRAATTGAFWHPIRGDFGQRITCRDGQVGVGFCASGENRDCNGASHTLTCAYMHGGGGRVENGIRRVNFNVASKQSEWLSREWGGLAVCPKGTVVTGICASGANADCNGRSHEVRCTKVYMDTNE